MDTRKIAKRYAKALLESFKTSRKALHCLDELREINDRINSSSELTELLDFPQVSRFSTLYESGMELKKFSSITQSFLRILMDKERLKLLSEIIESFEEMIWKSENTSLVKVISAMPLSKKINDGLRSGLKEKLGRDVVLKNEIDPSLIGSIRLEMGDKVIDGSVSARLVRIKKSIVGAVKEI